MKSGEAVPLEIHRKAFDDLAADIRSKGVEPIIFIPSPGNWGDSLINSGSREFFQLYRIQYIEVKRNELNEIVNTEDSHVVVGGGGGWCKFWHSTPEFIIETLPKVRHLTVLPSSIADPPQAPGPSDKMTIYTRGETNLANMRYDLRICHDMAFHCSDGANIESPQEGVLLAFREDKESGRPSLSPGNIDLSLKGNGYTDPRPFYKRLSKYTEIHTDRLHVGIASAQLGLDVHLYPSAYPKIEGVFNQSMEDGFTNVTPHF